jgi:multiple sugar transport system substrate-binding protein
MNRFRVTVLCAFMLCATGCRARPAGDSGDQTGASSGQVVLKVWGHAGRQSERDTIRDHVAEFNRSRKEIEIDLTLLPEGSYNSQVQAAALANDLPDILEFDGPFVYSYAWQGHLTPVGKLVSEQMRTNAIPSIIKQGTYRNNLYSLGMYDSGLALYARRSRLEEVDARIPESPEEAWTVKEFEKILADLAERDGDGQVLDLKLNYRGEWYTYAFMPALISGGGDLIDRTDFQTASNVLNGTNAMEVMQTFQRWVDSKGWVDQNVDDNAFTGGRVPFSWVGHWEYRRYRDAWGDDLVLLPLPDFGNGSRTAQGSWNWGITKKCKHPEKAMRFIEFLLGDEQIVAMTDANAAVPGTHSAIAESELYSHGNLLWLFTEQLTDGYCVPRPRTPAYPVITTVFRQAFNDIINGADVRKALNSAATDINRDIRDNRGYPSVDGEK